MPDVMPDVVALNRIQRKHALQEELFRLRDSRTHMQSVVKADRELLGRHKARMQRHMDEIERLHQEERRIRDRIRDIEAEEREAGDG